MKHIYLSLLIIVLGCASQKTDNNSNEDYQVLNAYLEQDKDSIIFNTSALTLDDRKPKSFFQSYLYFSRKFKKIRIEKVFFDENEIEELKAKYPNWKADIWDAKLIKKKEIKFVDNFKNKTFNLTEKERAKQIKVIRSSQKWVYTISKPFYDKDNEKAFLIIYRAIEYNNHAGGLGIAKMQKIKGKWKYVGNAPTY